MHRRRLMHSPRYRLKLMYGKGIGVYIAIPAYNIKWMIQVIIRIHHILLLYVKEKFPLHIVRFQLDRLPDVSLAIRRMLFKLTNSVAIALWRHYRPKRLHDKQAVVRGIKMHLINRSPRYDQIIAITKG